MNGVKQRLGSNVCIIGAQRTLAMPRPSAVALAKGEYNKATALALLMDMGMTGCQAHNFLDSYPIGYFNSQGGFERFDEKVRDAALGRGNFPSTPTFGESPAIRARA